MWKRQLQDQCKLVPVWGFRAQSFWRAANTGNAAKYSDTVHRHAICVLASIEQRAAANIREHMQNDDVAGDLDASMEEFQEWLQEMDTGLRDLQRDLGKLDRDILSKKQLIEANKAQYTRVSTCDAAFSSLLCCQACCMVQLDK